MEQLPMGVRAVARVLVMNEAGELLLCRSRNGKSWVPPGGTLDPGESLVEAAVREALEEVGLVVEPGPLAFLQEYRPAGRNEHVVIAAFRARATSSQPAAELRTERSIEPAGPPDRPWSAWFIQDVDGPRREVRWFSKEQVQAVSEPVYPPFLRTVFWDAAEPSYDLYVGLNEEH